ncbi:hypothetical protein F5144DRAFT_498749 [Chaetomium tenue]|uniref:Uncharacterized protein n=1 Tax=Chaetomium tenue TaxID=1854479 RepID=A0ACB7NUM1_9PEZI|nr:hypothetical protein F5144DRAFT_498749 [Chaetomium globosum]
MPSPTSQPTTTPQTPADPHPHLTALRTRGFIHIPSLLTPPELATLRTAAATLTATARAGGWPHVRTVGKQFPPWDASLVPERAGIWGVQHLLHPDLPVGVQERGGLGGVYFHGGLLKVVGEDGGELTMELFNMLVRPEGVGVAASGERAFELRWHRDDIPATATAEEEVARLKGPDDKYVHTQWNLPLYDDDSLIVIPGSHARARTEEERNAGPYEEYITGQVRVQLKAGDVVFYDNNILHRGVYDVAKERATLHGSVGHVSASRERARNVLQHGVGEWVDRCDFSVLKDEKQRKTAEAMRQRLVQLGRENEGKDVGFSLEG